MRIIKFTVKGAGVFTLAHSQNGFVLEKTVLLPPWMLFAFAEWQRENSYIYQCVRMHIERSLGDHIKLRLNLMPRAKGAKAAGRVTLTIVKQSLPENGSCILLYGAYTALYKELGFILDALKDKKIEATDKGFMVKC
jgi:hypothetical protein